MRIREGKVADVPLILSTWLRGLRYGNKYYGAMDAKSYFTNYKRVIEHIISKSVVLVACDDDDEDTIFGYAVVEPGLLHWVYVKELHRRRGIANQLIAGWDISRVTHETKIGEAIRRKHNWALDIFRI